MIRYVRTGQIAQDKQAEATKFAIEVTNYVNAKHPAVTLQVFTMRFGVQNTIYWTADVDDLSALDSYQKAVGADEGYWAILGKAQGLLVTSSLEDKVMETITAN